MAFWAKAPMDTQTCALSRLLRCRSPVVGKAVGAGATFRARHDVDDTRGASRSGAIDVFDGLRLGVT